MIFRYRSKGLTIVIRRLIFAGFECHLENAASSNSSSVSFSSNLSSSFCIVSVFWVTYFKASDTIPALVDMSSIIKMPCTTRDCSRPAVHYYTHYHHPSLENAKCIFRREDENHCHFWYCEKDKNEFDDGIPQDCKEPSRLCCTTYLLS
jgi:hypothetical protein